MQEKGKITEESGVLCVRFLGDIDHHFSLDMRMKIDSAIFNVRPKELLLDFSSVRFMDSSGIGLIMGRVEKCRSIDASVTVVGMSGSLLKLSRLAGLYRVENLLIKEGKTK